MRLSETLGFRIPSDNKLDKIFPWGFRPKSCQLIFVKGLVTHSSTTFF